MLYIMSLDLDRLALIVHTDAGFANADGKKSPLGCVIVATDGNLANIIDWGSTWSTPVTLFSLAAELIGIFCGFDRVCLT